MNDEQRTEPRILVVDVETTGLNSDVHSIVEIGAVWLMGGEGEFHRKCRMFDAAAIDPEAFRINGRTEEDCMDMTLPSESKAVREFFDWVGLDSAILAGLTPSFDRSFLRAANRRAGRPPMKVFAHRVLDLHSLAVSYALAKGEPVPSRGFHTDEIYTVLNLEPEPRPHEAIIGARKEAEALRMLLGLPNLKDNPLDCAP